MKQLNSPARRLTGTLGASLMALILLLATSVTAQATRPSVLVLSIDGAIGPATTEYVREGLARADAQDARLVVLRMDTPGGLASATREIVQEILASPTPVATYVSPAGARAASAGAYILYASHLAAMAPGTHVGAATPVAMGGSTPLPPAQPAGKPASPEAPPADAMSAKAINDAAAHMASLANLHGRNAQWAERAVREAATLTAEQAKADGVIELRPANLAGLLSEAEGRTVTLAGRSHVLRVAGAPVVEFRPNWRIKALGVITNPNIAYLLLLVGVYGLLFEFMSPGGVGPGVVGAVALLVALFALNLLPVNYAGLALLLLGIGLMAAEAYTPSFGVLGLGGASAFAVGSLFLFKGPVPELRLAPGVALTAAVLSAAYFAVALGAAVRARRASVAIGPSTLTDASGRVLNWRSDRGLVEVGGEHWHAHAARVLAPGSRVRVVGRRGLVLDVEPADGANPSGPSGPDPA